ncbi:MAG: hypothetical protein M3Y59_25785 [Myxococcota bacterium]|nr:hypothetical protein [Myxococcota bacterium]
MTRCFPKFFKLVLLSAVVAIQAVAQTEALSEPPLASDLEMEEAPAAPPPATASSAEKPLSRVTLRDGQQLRGRVVAESKDAVTLELISGGRMALSRHSISKMEVEEGTLVSSTGQLWFRDPNRTRYLYSPSAMRLRKGEGYFSQKELVFSSVAFGLTDHVTLLAGAMLPLWMMGGNGLNFIGGIKAGFSPSENFHLAAGAETLVLPAWGFQSSSVVGAGFVFVGGTLGDHNAHFTVNVGRPFMFANTSQSLGEAIVTLNGNVRLGANFALVTENWLLPGFFGTPLAMINSLGGRIMGERFAVDLAVLRVETFQSNGLGMIPIPWVDFTYNFG